MFSFFDVLLSVNLRKITLLCLITGSVISPICISFKTLFISGAKDLELIQPKSLSEGLLKLLLYFKATSSKPISLISFFISKIFFLIPLCFQMIFQILKF